VLQPGTPTTFGRNSVLLTGLPRGEKTAIIVAKRPLGQYPAALQNSDPGRHNGAL